MTSSSEAKTFRLNVKPKLQVPIWRHLLWGLVAIAGLWALSKIPSTLIVFSMAWLIAYLLNPAVDRLTGERLGPIKSCSRGQAVGLVAVLLLGALIAAGAMMVPQLTDQVNKLLSIQKSLGDPTELPVLLRERAEPILARVPEKYREEVMTKATHFIQESASKIGHWASQIVSYIGAFLGQILSAIFLLSSAFLISLYMLMNWHGLAGGLLEKLPRQYQREVKSLSLKLNEIFGGYLKATILTAIACMIATFISLLILEFATGKDFPYKGLVSFVAGISYPIPVIGIIATSILGGVLGFVADGHMGFGVAVLATINVVNIIIDRTVQPRLMSDAIGVSELFVMFAAFAGGEVAGVWGMLLGIPVAAMGKTLFEWFHLNFLLVDDDHSETAVAHPFTEPPTASSRTVKEPERTLKSKENATLPSPVSTGPTPEFATSKAAPVEPESDPSKASKPETPTEPEPETEPKAEPGLASSTPATEVVKPETISKSPVDTRPDPPPGPAIPASKKSKPSHKKKKK